MPPALLVVLAAICFGTTGTAQTFAPESASATSVGAARLVVGGAVLALVGGALAWRARVRRRTTSGRPGAPVTSTGPAWDRVAVLAVACAALAMVAYQPTFFAGTRANGVAVGTLVTLGAGPLCAGALEWLVLRRRPGPRWLVATAVAVVGVALLAGGGGGAVDVAGLGASLAAGLSYAAYAVATKVLLERGHAVVVVVPLVFGLGALVSLPVLLASGPGWLATPSGALVALWLGVVTVAVAYLLFGAGLRHLPAATAATLTLAEPVTAGLLGVLLLQEQLAPLAWVGVAVVVMAVVILTASPRWVSPARALRR